MFHNVVDNTPANPPPARPGGDWTQLKLRGLAAKDAVSPYWLGPIAFALRAVFYLIFLVLLWIRPLIHGLFRVLGGLCLLSFVLGLFVVPEKHRPVVWVLGAASFTVFVLSWFYDWLLLKISPEPIGFID